MARPIYPHELSDSDFSWLISRYQDQFKNSIIVENLGQPVVILNILPDEIILIDNQLRSQTSLSFNESKKE